MLAYDPDICGVIVSVQWLSPKVCFSIGSYFRILVEQKVDTIFHLQYLLHIIDGLETVLTQGAEIEDAHIALAFLCLRYSLKCSSKLVYSDQCVVCVSVGVIHIRIKVCQYFILFSTILDRAIARTTCQQRQGYKTEKSFNCPDHIYNLLNSRKYIILHFMRKFVN